MTINFAHPENPGRNCAGVFFCLVDGVGENLSDGRMKKKSLSKLKTTALVAYGQFGLAMAFVGLPIYVHAPKFYSETLGMPLALLGLLLFIPRILDALQDPFIGAWSDRLASGKFSRLKIIAMTSPLLAAGFFALFAPPVSGAAGLGLWMVLALIVIYTAFSFITINLQAMAVELSSDYHERTRITSWRESFVLMGLLLASALPQVLVERLGAQRGYLWFGVLFAGLLVVSYLIMARGLRKTKMLTPENPEPLRGLIRRLWVLCRANRHYRWMLGLGLLNATASSIPAALVLFFVDDIVQAPDHTGYFLALYFLSGALGMPFWVWLSKRMGKRAAWMASLLLSVVIFIWAFSLGAGAVYAYYLICVLSGLCLGADYALPPSLLADIIAPPGGGNKAVADSGAYMGIWVLNTKLALALSSTIALPLLALIGYNPSQAENTPQALLGLSCIYALLPCVFKIAAGVLLWLSPIDRKKI